MASPPARFTITQRVAWRDSSAPKGALKWRWGTVTAVALSKMDTGDLAYEYLIAGGDGHMYLRWDHELVRPSDGDVDRFRDGRAFAAGGVRPGSDGGGAAGPPPPAE
jgi:hypothetical protein